MKLCHLEQEIAGVENCRSGPEANDNCFYFCDFNSLLLSRVSLERVFLIALELVPTLCTVCMINMFFKYKDCRVFT